MLIDKLISIPFLIFLPMLASLIIMSPFFTSNEISIRRFAKGFFGFHFLYAILMLVFFDQANPFESHIHFFGLDWVQSLGINFTFKTDCISLILSVLTSFIFLISSIESPENVEISSIDNLPEATIFFTEIPQGDSSH